MNPFLNYTVRNDSLFAQSKISFSINNLFNDESITDVASSTGAAPVGTSTYLATTAPSPLDELSLTAGRSYMVTLRLGIFPNRSK